MNGHRRFQLSRRYAVTAGCQFVAQFRGSKASTAPREVPRRDVDDSRRCPCIDHQQLIPGMIVTFKRCDNLILHVRPALISRHLQPYRVTSVAGYWEMIFLSVGCHPMRRPLVTGQRISSSAQLVDEIEQQLVEFSVDRQARLLVRVAGTMS